MKKGTQKAIFLQIERLCKQVPIENPYAWDLASKFDAMTMETFTRENLSNQGAFDTIQIACRACIGNKILF